MRSYKEVFAVLTLFLAACGSNSNPSTASAVATTCTPTGVTVYGGSDPSHPLAPLSVNLPSDSDSSVYPITPNTNIYFTVMVPDGCPGQTFPVILNAPGWGLTRSKTAAKNGDFDTTSEMAISIQALITQLPWHGYVLISFDERGMGDSVPKEGGGYARVIDPALETQDARALLDWAYDNASLFQIQTQPDSGIDKDIKVGTLGLSYGGGFQLPLAALDQRIDAAVPTMAWHDLAYSLVPGDAMKLSWIGILCGAGGTDMILTPVVENVCGISGPANANADQIRTLDDVIAAATAADAKPRPLTGKSELLDLFYSHGQNYLQDLQSQQQPWVSMTDGTLFANNLTQASTLRPVPTLFLQGNRDVLFNLTQGYWNWKQWHDAGGDVRILSNEGGHINPLAGQQGLTNATPDCGVYGAVPSAAAWFDYYLKGIDSSVFESIPTICISVANTQNIDRAKPVGVVLDQFPVGSLGSGTGALPAIADSLTADVPVGTTNPVFVPVVTLSDSNHVIAGVPTIGSLTVNADAGATQEVVAFVGVGILRNGTAFLVDDQVTGFAQGTHTTTHDAPDLMPSEYGIQLPAVGEQLQSGDQVGLLFYPSHPQYLPLAGSSNFVNPYNVQLSDVELPIFQPGVYPNSSLSQ